jgi:hypothetical protein
VREDDDGGARVAIDCCLFYCMRIENQQFFEDKGNGRTFHLFYAVNFPGNFNVTVEMIGCS